MSPTALLTPDDLLTMPDGERYELVEGIPKEKGVGAKSNEISGLVYAALLAFVRPRKLGRAYLSETGYVCFPGKPKSVRFPDVSFVRTDRIPNGVSPDGYFTVRPDLAVEVISPNDLYEEVEEKLTDYREAGIPLVWVVSPRARTVLVRRLDGSANLLLESGELSGEDVVPGFTCKIAELFD
jgi:Uma2 family endonuclease